MKRIGRYSHAADSSYGISVSPSGVPMRETGIALVAVGFVTLAITAAAHYALLDRARPAR